MERTPEEIAIEREWVKESARRYQQLEDGTAESIPADEVFARLEERLRKRE